MIYTKNYWEDVALAAKQICKAEKLQNKKVLITGATGMVCSAIVEMISYLNKSKNANITLYLAGRNEERVKNRFHNICEYKFIYFDTLSGLVFDEELDYIIHGASNANPNAYSAEPVETLVGNIIGTQALLEVAKRKQAKMLYISSSEVYGNKTDNGMYVETDYGYIDILNPRACYPNGKRAAETLCVSYGLEYGVEIVIVRPGHIYGPTITANDTRASAQFTRNVLNGENIVMKSSGMQKRSYCYTLDCASAILFVLLNGKNGEAYNISNKQSVVTIKDLAEEMAEYAGVDVTYEVPSDNEVKGYNMMTNSSLNAEKLEQLGWSAVFDIKQGVKSTIDTMRLFV